MSGLKKQSIGNNEACSSFNSIDDYELVGKYPRKHEQVVIDYPDEPFIPGIPGGGDYFNANDAIHAEKIREFESEVTEKLKEESKENELMVCQQWTNTGLHLVALITEHLVSHPFIVLRRQCQVNNKLQNYHILPISLIPVILNVHRWQGLTCLWKGVGSVLIIKGMTLAIQDLLSKITLWPKELNHDSTVKNMTKHIALKLLTCVIITPFYSASVVETVQSEIASERPEILDVFKEGFRRLSSFGIPKKGRMLPVWSLIVPTASYFILRHFFAILMKNLISRSLVSRKNEEHRKQGAIPKDYGMKMCENIEIISSLAAVLSADIILYPMETVLHKLHLQGTRTIIDNLDDGLSVTPILTNFEGVKDCYESTVCEEGVLGLYKGFGAMVLQCLAYTSIFKLSKFILTQISTLFSRDSTTSHKNEMRRSGDQLPSSMDINSMRMIRERDRLHKSQT